MVNDQSAESLKSSTEAATAAMENATVVVFAAQMLMKGVLKKLMGALVLL